MNDAPDKVINLEKVRDAFDQAKPREKKKTARGASRGGGSGGGDAPPGGFERIWRLPSESPVKALGFNGLDYHILARSGQRITLPAAQIKGPNINALFGDTKFLIAHWPSFDRNGNPVDFKHAHVTDALIATCQDAGLWDPADKERGVGCWAEDDVLVFHCGDILATSKGRSGTGVRGRLLYPAAPRISEPTDKALPSKGAEIANAEWGVRSWGEIDGPGARVMEKLVTWNMARPHLDAMLFLGFIGCCLLGAAPEWRPMCCLSGDSRTGKSTLLKLVKWLIGEGAYASSGNATQAAIARKVGNSSKPVILDELERNANNDRVEKLIELMVLSSSGETLDRGTPGSEYNSFQSRNCFLISAVSPPPLRPQDLNRLLMVELGLLDGGMPAPGDDDSEGVDSVLGAREVVDKIGRELRARLLAGWKRYHRTFHDYCRALRGQGHDRRGGDQFGALLTAYDLIMFDEADASRAAAAAALMPATRLSETSGTVSNHEACMQYLLAATPMLIRGGANETVAYWLRQARGAVESNKSEEIDDALRTLAKAGLKVFRKKGTALGSNDKATWMVAISHESEGLARIFAHSKWSKSSGTTAGWPQMFKRLAGAELLTEGGGRLRIRIDGWRQYVTYVPWETIFPRDEAGDAAEAETVDMRDRSL